MILVELQLDSETGLYETTLSTIYYEDNYMSVYVAVDVQHYCAKFSYYTPSVYSVYLNSILRVLLLFDMRRYLLGSGVTLTAENSSLFYACTGEFWELQASVTGDCLNLTEHSVCWTNAQIASVGIFRDEYPYQ